MVTDYFTDTVMDEASHARVQARLRRCQIAEAAWTVHLRLEFPRAGVWHRREQHIARTHQERRECADPGWDVAMAWRATVRRYNVKWLGYAFTGAHDWPFRRKHEHRQFIVSSQAGYDGVAEPPDLYASVSPDLLHYAVVDVHQVRSVWRIEPFPHHAGGLAPTYCVPLRYVRFGRMLGREHPYQEETP